MTGVGGVALAGGSSGAAGSSANVLADGAAVCTLSNQSPSSEMPYNDVHDFKQAEWAAIKALTRSNPAF